MDLDEQMLPEGMSLQHMSPKIQKKSVSALKQSAQASEEIREHFDAHDNPLEQFEIALSTSTAINFAGHINTANVTLGPKLNEATTPKQNQQ